MKNFLFATVFASVCSFAIADDPPADEAREAEDRQGRIVLEEPAKTVDEALERRSAAEAEAMKELEAAQKAFDDRMAAVNQRTIADLEGIARRAVADGQLAEAAKAWEEVLRLDPEHRDAREFFRTLGRLDEVEKRLAKVPGDDRRVWVRGSSKKPAFVLQPDGRWKEIRTTGAHKMWTETSRDAHTIEMSRPGGQSLRLHRGGFYWTSTDGKWAFGESGKWRSDAR